MANYDEIAFLAAIEVLEEAEVQAEQPQRQFYHNRDAFAMSDINFLKMFRFPKHVVEEIVDMVAPYVTDATRTSAISVKQKVLLALRLFASGSYQVDIGSNIHTAVSQPSVSRCFREVVNALNQPEIFNTWVKFPQNLHDLSIIRNEFYQKFGFPGVIGCIDGTHVAIVSPQTGNQDFEEHLYVNRKNYHSINVQLVCDSNMRIINVNARFPGSTHDSFIWSNSILKEFMQRLNTDHKAYYLLGDSGYPLRPWLLTPLEHEPLPESPEAAYNRHHKRTRCLIERCIGLLKMRFRCLLRHRVLHYAPDVASQIVNACVVLHNICIYHNVPDPEEEEGDDQIDFGYIVNTPHENEENNQARRINPHLVEARQLQRRIIRNHFAQL